MIENETVLQEIITGDLQVLYNLLEKDKDETPELAATYKKVKYGIKIKYHIQHLLQKNYTDRSRSNEIQLGTTIYPLEAWWDEEEARRSTARKALYDHYNQEQKPYEGR